MIFSFLLDVNLWGMGSDQVAAVLRQCGSSVRLVVARPWYANRTLILTQNLCGFRNTSASQIHLIRLAAPP